MHRKYSKNVQRLIEQIKHQCEILDVNFQLTNSYKVNSGEGDRCEGYFEPPDQYVSGILKVGTKSRETHEWVLTLAHEYAHMLQWFYKDELYKKFERDDDYYSALEIHTEKQALKILRNFNIPITKKLRRNSDDYVHKLKMGMIRFKKS